MRKLSSHLLRQSMYDWHGGQESPLYAAASSGLVDDLTALEGEILNNAAWLVGEPNCAKFPNEKITAANRAESARLKKYADALDGMLSLPFTASDGRVYRALPWAKEKPFFVPVAIRRDRKTKECGLFFYVGEGARQELNCYFHVGQHSGASLAYMRDKTTSASMSEPDCAALVKEWEGMGPVGTYARIVQRLSRGG